MLRNYRWITAFGALLFLLYLPAASMGQRMPQAKWWHLPQVAKDLDIREQEKKDLDDLFTENRRSLIDLKAALQKERFELDILMDKSPLEEDAVMDRFKKLEKARADLMVQRFRFLIGVRKILGPERYQSLKMLFREYREKKRQPVE